MELLDICTIVQYTYYIKGIKSWKSENIYLGYGEKENKQRFA